MVALSRWFHQQQVDVYTMPGDVYQNVQVLLYLLMCVCVVKAV
jgi:hypothetical protein